MNIIVISLKRAKERRRAIKYQLKKLDIDAIIMDAVDKKDLPYKDKNKKISRPNWREGGLMNDGEIACIQSNIKALKIAKEKKWDYVIILEDDVVLSKSFERGIKIIFKMVPSDWELLYLSVHTYLNAVPTFWPNIIPCRYKTSGSYSYIVNSKAYDKIISKLSLYEAPVDDAIEYLNIIDRKLNAYMFFPFLTYPKIKDSYIWDKKQEKTEEHPSKKYFRDTV